MWPYDAPGQYLTQATAFIVGATDQHADPAYTHNGTGVIMDPALIFADPADLSGAELPGMWELADLIGGQTDMFADPTAPAGAVSYEILSQPVPDEAHPDHRSVSQLETYADCGLKYRLQRYHGSDAPGRPQGALVGGNAFHAAVERFERWRHAEQPAIIQIDPVKAWEFDLGLTIQDTMEADEQRHPVDTWRASAKGEEGYDWWRVEGADMLERYLKWSAAMRARGWTLVERAGWLIAW